MKPFRRKVACILHSAFAGSLNIFIAYHVRKTHDSDADSCIALSLALMVKNSFDFCYAFQILLSSESLHKVGTDFSQIECLFTKQLC